MLCCQFTYTLITEYEIKFAGESVVKERYPADCSPTQKRNDGDTRLCPGTNDSLGIDEAWHR